MGSDRGPGGRPRGPLRAAIVVAALAGALFAVPSAFATLYTVTSTSDPGFGVCDELECTLREAITAANGDAAADTITFQIGIGGSYTISPTTPLPDILQPVTIDATTQTGYAGAPLIELNGFGAGAGAHGLSVTAGSATIRGLAILNFGGAGISFTGSSSGSLVTGNYIGIESGGAFAQGNTFGVLVASSGNTIGGTTAATRNIISGNAANGLTLFGSTNVVRGNYVGVDASGNFAVPNLRGVVVAADTNTIGGADSARNVISGNTGVGLSISGASVNTVTGNYVGTDAYGTSAVPNGGPGIQIQGGESPANTNTIASNVISGNGGAGLLITATTPNFAGNNAVQGNLIGTDASGKNALGNTGAGVLIDADSGIGNNTIGGSANTIAYNAKGIVAGSGTARNKFAKNSIHDNVGLGIDLGDDGPTPNDPNDGDTGANELLNYPVLTGASRSATGQLTVIGSFDGALPDSQVDVDFYVTPACDGSGFGEGAIALGTLSLLSDGSGDAAFNVGPGYARPNMYVTATATDELGETSEFSQCLAVTEEIAGTSLTVNTTLDHNDGSCDADCTLREAILAANSFPGTDTIGFSVGGIAVFAVSNGLPPITDDVVIDGTTAPAFAGTPVVRLDGFDAPGFFGLDVQGGVDGSTIRGLSITRFSGGGIRLSGPPSVLEGNYIGVLTNGVVGAGNAAGGIGAAGVYVESAGNRIGGTSATQRNVISGNIGAGVWFATGSDNVVAGNRIGTTAAGDGPVPNTNDGVVIEDAGPQTIGGTAAGAGNLVSGNGSTGVVVLGSNSSGSVVQGNTIGLDATGSIALANGDVGVNVTGGADGVQVGGSVSDAGNVISGNASTGLLVESSSGGRIQGNLIGLSVAGDAAVPNGAGQLAVSSSDTLQIGGTTAGARNVISGSTSSNGILLDSGSNDNVIEGNYVGTDASGELGIGNGDGINISAGSANNTIGGVVAGARNVISGSNGPGIRLDSAGSGNRILGNSIGTDKDETTAIPNDIGIELDGTAGTLVGSSSPRVSNVIGGNFDVGILVLLGSDNNTFNSNFIGTNRGDTVSIPNGEGMRFTNGGGNNNLIGPDNVVANNLGFGIDINTGTGNRISANSIHDNGNKGISLSGGNNGQPAPVLFSAVNGDGVTTADGSLSAAPLTSYFVEIFLTPSCTGEPQGRTYLGFQTVTTNVAGDGTVSFTSNIPAAGDVMTVTATSQTTGDTSEFSACRTVTSATDLTTTLTPDAITALAGGLDGYTITIDNPTASDVTLDSVSATLPAGLYYVRNSAKLGASFVNPFGVQPAMTGTLTWNGSFLVPAGGSFTAHFDVGTTQVAGTYTTSATAVASGGEPVVGDSAPISVVAALSGSVAISPEADTMIDAANPTTNYGTQGSFTTFGGNMFSNPGPQYGLLRFDLSSLPPGVAITSARLRLVSNDGFAYDGDPSHHAIFINDDSWTEAEVTWDTRPNDNPLGFPNITTSKANLGSDVVFYGGLGGFGDQMHLFQGPQAGTGFVRQRVAAEALSDQRLSIELFNGCCGPGDTAYTATYYSRETPITDVRPELVVTYATDTAQPGPTFTVNTDGDYDDGTCGLLDCTLREAINAANGAAGANTIAFGIPGSAPFTIQPDSALPAVTDPVTIDGSTQTGFTADPVVAIDGSAANADVLVLGPGSGGSTIRSLVVNKFTNHDGILLQSGGNVVEASFIGTTADGLDAAVGGFGNAIDIQSSNNAIGGGSAERNVIVAGDSFGSGGNGVLLDGSGGIVSGNLIQGNYIGLDKNGVHGLGGSTGVQTLGAATQNIIGGATAASGNVIAGVFNGIIFGSSADPRAAGSGDNNVQFNVLGLQADGSSELTELANHAGILDDAIDVWDLGFNTFADNVISSSFQGIFLIDSGFNVVNRNKIGTDTTGTANRGNRSVGIAIDQGVTNMIGGGLGDGNLVGFNAGGGIAVRSANSNTISQNAVGTNAAGTEDLHNGTTFPAIELNSGSSGNIVGAGNIVKFSVKAGIVVNGASSVGNRITQNSVDGNADLGIDLGADGVTPNDALDADDGANHLQNFPVITSAVASASTTQIDATLDTVPGTYTIEYFESPTCDPSGNGEGATFLGSASIAFAIPNQPFTITHGASLAPGTVVTMTAMGETASTSEFSACATVQPGVIATNLSLVPEPTSAAAGAARVKLADVPPLTLLQPQSSQQAAPVNQTPVNQTPVNQLATTNAPVNQTPINQTPVNQTPVNQSGFAELTQSISQLGSIQLSSIPLLRIGGWDALLANTPLAGIPLQNVTLRDLYALNPLPGPLQANATNPITIGELDLSRNALGSLPAMAFTLGKLPLAEIPTTSGTYVDWCTAAAVQGVNCTSSTSTILSAGIEGAPVNQTPVNQTPVNQTLIQALATFGTPINQTPVNQTPINQTQIGALPVNQTPVNQTPVNQLSLEAILAANAPVNQTPVNQTPVNQLSNPSAIVDCNLVDCSTATLGSAFAANAILPGVTLGDLRANAPASLLATWTLADLRDYGNLTIGDLLASLPQPNSFTLADVLLLVLGSPSGVQGLSFEGINIFDTGLPGIATGGSTVDYRAQFTLQATGSAAGLPTTVDLTSTLPSGFLYVAGSSKLVQSPGTCATATAIANPAAVTLNDGRLKLTWSLDGTVGDGYSVCFTARPGIVLGPQAASLDAQPAGAPTASATGTALDVDDTLEPNGTAATAPELFNDSFYLSYLTSAADVDYYRFAAPPAGTVMTFHLSHLPTDYDLVVYGPPETQLRPSLTSAVPLDEPPVTDSGVDTTHTTDILASQTLDDLRLQTDLPMVGVSASRNTDPEDVVVTSQGGSGYYTIQITGYNGATSAKPYMLRVATAAPRVTSTVPSTTTTGTVGPALPALPSGLNTVFLVNRQRLESIYGSTAASSVISALTNDSAAFRSLGFPNVILSVERFTSVQNAYSAWDANPGNPAAANGVVQAINGVIDQQIRAQPNGAGLKYLVIVGGDQVIPFARLDDFTVTASNEAGYASTFATNSDLFATLNLGQMLSDDPYGDVNPVPYLTRQLYIPELSVGRLVETPTDIVATLNRFVTFSGRLDPTTSLTTGYDFLFDGASAVNTALRTRVGATAAATLFDDPAQTGDSWTLALLLGAFLPPNGAPSITSLNGHASHYQFEPPRDDLTGARSSLFTTSALTSSTSPLTNRLVFSMGCHAGLSVADSIVTAGSTLDWPQAYAQKGAGAYLGNTGYGYGDSLVVAYSEELNRLFAQNISAGSAVGDALASAKQAYFGELGVFGVYDEKSMAEFTLYGLPMWSVTAPPTGGAAAQTTAAAPLRTTAAKTAPTIAQPLSVVTDPTTGLDAETFSVDPTNTEHSAGAAGTFWSGPDGVQVTHLRPIQPKQLVSLTGATAHGALITDLTSNDMNCEDPVYARPVVDLTGNEGELSFADVAFPSKVQTVRTFETPNGRVQQLVLVTGQFFTQPCTTNPDPQFGVQRLFSHVAGRVFRSQSTDYISPAFQLIDATQVSSNAAFSVDVTDRTPTGTGQVKQVLVGVRSGAASAWTFANLAQSASNPARWTGGVPISGTQFEYFVQAVDAAGNVGVSTNKGFYFVGAPAPPPPTGDVTATLVGTQSNSWFTSSPTLDITAPAGVTVEASVDGGPFGPPPSSITGDGLHTIDIRASNGDTATLFAPVDTTAPEIVINTPVNGAQYVLDSEVKADYFCRDSGSGVATPCTGTVPNGDNIDTSSLGTTTFTVNGVSDAAGHSTGPKTVTYTVVLRRKLLFASSRTAGGDIYAMNPDGTQLTQLTSTAGADEQPAWSPDGSKIAFASKRNDANGTLLDIYVMNPNGTNVVRLTNATGDDTAPAWSNDGTKIAFQSKRDGNIEVYVMNADGTNQKRLTDNPNQDLEPAWSPNGQKIAFASNRSGGPNIWVMNANGTNPVRLTTSTQPEGGPSWSPDGTRIAFSSKRTTDKTGTASDIYTMKPDGTDVVRVASAKADDLEPTWSRDGQKIAFTAQRDGNPEIYVMNKNGTDQTRLTTNSSSDRQPDW